MKRVISTITVVFILFNLISTQVQAADSLQVARYIMSWQLPSGGWSKNNSDHFTRYWDGQEDIADEYLRDGVTPMGTIDNDATIKEMRFLAEAYFESGNAQVRDSFNKGLEYLLTMQYETGGFPQVYPLRDKNKVDYQNFATFNDDAMTNVLSFMFDVLNDEVFKTSDIISEETRSETAVAYEKGIEFILNTQIEVDGIKTAWSGQYDPVSLEPMHGRKFEPISIMTWESINLINFLDTVEQTPEIQEAVYYAKLWVKEVAIQDSKFYLKGVDGDKQSDSIVEADGEYMWYRFYEIGTNRGLFGDRDRSVHYDINDIGDSVRWTYGWAGNWGSEIITTTIMEPAHIGGDMVAAIK